LEGSVSVVDELETVVGDICYERSSWGPGISTGVGDSRDDDRAKRNDIGGWSLEKLNRHGACCGGSPGDDIWSADWDDFTKSWFGDWVACVSALGGL
jgi:hypothetical protein